MEDVERIMGQMEAALGIGGVIGKAPSEEAVFSTFTPQNIVTQKFHPNSFFSLCLMCI